MEQKWYRTKWCKGILVGLNVICAGAMVVCLFWSLVFGRSLINELLVNGKVTAKYEDSHAFKENMNNTAYQILRNRAVLRDVKYLSTGEPDPNQLVDAEVFNEKSIVSGKNESGLSYRLKDLGIEGGSEDKRRYQCPVIVCQRSDQTFAYYTSEEFIEKAIEGELIFALSASEKEQMNFAIDSNSSGELAKQFANGENPLDGRVRITDGDGKLLYSACWGYDGDWPERQIAPYGYDSILELVNTSEAWNGRLEMAVRATEVTDRNVRSTIEDAKRTLDEYEKDSTLVFSPEGLSEISQDDQDKYRSMGNYLIISKKNGVVAVDTDLRGNAMEWEMLGNQFPDQGSYTFALALDGHFPVKDSFYQEKVYYEHYAPTVAVMLAGGFAFGVGWIITIILLAVWQNAREKGQFKPWEKYYKTELFLLLSGLLFVVSCTLLLVILEAMFKESWGSYVDGSGFKYAANENTMYGLNPMYMAILGGTAAFCGASFLPLWLGTVRRFKEHTFWGNSFLRAAIRGVGNFWHNRRLLWKGLFAAALLVLFNLTAAIAEGDGWTVLMLFVNIGAAVILLKGILVKEQIHKGAVEIAGGNLDYQIPTARMKGEALETAEAINGIGTGLEKALGESLASERMKTELITNVSHDIKTPLTSIINYIDLLKRENPENENAKKYIEILEEKAQRLKILTEDVVEASRASSGNVKLEMTELDFGELVKQTSAELGERFEQRNLNLVLKLPDEPCVIRADGRRLWRVLFNIFMNASKYAMEGTRVYADLSKREGKVSFELKNVSENQLDIPAEELTERFVRGDVARNTEGSGLGLSIARDLTELMGGTFSINVDGDLFKVTISF